MKRTLTLIHVYIVYWLNNTNKHQFLTGIFDEEELQLVLRILTKFVTNKQSERSFFLNVYGRSFWQINQAQIGITV